MDTDSLKKELASVDTLLQDGIIDEKKAANWKARIIAQFEEDVIPPEPERTMPNDLSHLPGRIVAGGIEVGKAFLKGAGSTYEHLERQEIENNQKRGNKNVIELYNDLQ